MSDHSAPHEPHSPSSDDPNAAFNKAFDDEVRNALLTEDSEAWNNVTGELLTIVTSGVLFFTFIVWLISRY